MHAVIQKHIAMPVIYKLTFSLRRFDMEKGQSMVKYKPLHCCIQFAACVVSGKVISGTFFLQNTSDEKLIKSHYITKSVS